MRFKVICGALLFPVACYAGAPTIEQTQNYIAENGSIKYYQAYSDQLERSGSSYDDSSISWDDECLLRWKAKQQNFINGRLSSVEDVSIAVDLRSVSGVGVALYPGIGGSQALFIKLSKSNGQNASFRSTTTDILVGAVAGEETLASVKDMQIYKAFNHLRKLCGASDFQALQFE